MKEQIIFNFENVSRFDIEDFFENETNEDAVNWLMCWPDWPGQKLNIYGNYSCGKTHLASLWLKHTGGYKISDINGNARDLVDRHRDFLIDPFEDLIKIEHADRWLFDFINVCTEKSASLLIISRTTDFAEYTDLRDLLSRLNAISHVRILPPTDNLLRKIAQKISADLGIHLKDSVIEYIVNHTCRNVETVNDIILKLNELSLRNKKTADIKMVRSLLAN